jgi:hypothetical protein
MVLEGERAMRTHSRLLSAAARLSDAELLSRVVRLAGEERGATVELVAHSAELDARRLFLGDGFGSLFGYCTGALRLAEYAAYNRIEAARASRRFPAVLDLLADGSLNLSTVRLLAPHLRPENFETIVAMAKGRSKREVEVLVARLAPRPDVVASVRKLPAPAPAAEPPAEPPATASPAAGQLAAVPSETLEPATVQPSPVSAPTAPGPPGPGLAALPIPLPPQSDIPPAASPGVGDHPQCPLSVSSAAVAAERRTHRPVVAPLAADRYRVQFTIGEATHDKLRQVQELLRREIPDGDPGAIFDRALTLLLEDIARKKLAVTSQPRNAKPGAREPASSTGTRSRHIPARVKRDVWLRDRGRCAFVAPSGRRCGERAFLEFHHREPHAIGGEATTANISLRCRRHNAHEAGLVFGTRPGASWTLPDGVRRVPGPKISWPAVEPPRRHS